MSWPIAVAGTVHLDNITTPHGSRTRQQGGSMVYFALAASAYAPVHAAGIAGFDSDTSMRAALEGLPVDLTGVTVSATPTLQWTATHDFERWVAVHEHEEGGCDALWDAVLPAAMAAAPVLFVGSMLPAHQLRVIEQSQALLIGLDTMTVHLGRDHDLFQATLGRADVLFVNRYELAAITGEPCAAWKESARALMLSHRLRAVVVKAGPDGAAVVTASAVVERPPHGAEQVIDPTGAGDSLAGGFLGACAAAERDDETFFAGPALTAGLRSAAQAITTFGVEGLRSPLRPGRR